MDNRLPSSLRLFDAVRPRSAGAARATLETLAVYAVLLLPARLSTPDGAVAFSVLATVFTVVATLVLCVWPAWRMRGLHGFWPSRLARGAGRAILTAGAIAAGAVGLSALLLPSQAVWFERGAIALAAAGYCVFRLTFTSAAWLYRRLSSRLRWQLLMSHVAVIMLIVVALTSIGSAVGVAVLERGIRPQASDMARSIANQVGLVEGGAPASRERIDTVLREVYSGAVPLRGEPVLAGIAPISILPTSVIVLDSTGRVLDGRERIAGTDRRTRVIATRGAIHWFPTAMWRTLLSSLRSGRAASVTLTPLNPAQPLNTIAMAAVPSAGTPREYVLVQVPEVPLTSSQYVRAAVAAFGFTTLGIFLIISVPALAISFAFSYVVARRMTERFQAMSRVATAIAGGQFGERARVAGSDEVGKMAADINRMAARLEQTVAELEQARCRAEDALRQRQELVANVSHELRTPLAIIRSHLELAAGRACVTAGSPSSGTSPSPVGQDTLAALNQETLRLEALVNDLFTLSRAEGRALSVRPAPVNVGDVVGEIAATMRPLAEREGSIVLVTDVAPGLPPAWVDGERLRQIMSNLVRNAVRHTPDGGLISLSARGDGAGVEVCVADTGEGISPDNLPRIFDRFYRVDASRSRSTGGAGLGLAIVRELVEMMGGRIDVASVPGEGTKFRVWLPSHTTDG
ncbi:MAG TPA: ATP-binding protein [Chloroflexota bacterium]|nr:ATP-binding protein [Chloroflexota bacterium]